MQEGSEWLVKSEKADNSTLEMYKINKQESCGCKLRCNECQFCIHEFTCTCPDRAIRFIMCKHIHLLCSNLKKENEELGDCNDLVIDESITCVEKEIIEAHLLHQNQEEGVETVRDKAIALLNNMITKCKSPNMSVD